MGYFLTSLEYQTLGLPNLNRAITMQFDLAFGMEPRSAFTWPGKKPLVDTRLYSFDWIG
jgi:hypothetical protein